MARKAQLITSLEKLRADLNATVGAIQDCDFWLAQLEVPVQAQAEQASSLPE